jgi:hypothetical protein
VLIDYQGIAQRLLYLNKGRQELRYTNGSWAFTSPYFIASQVNNIEAMRGSYNSLLFHPHRQLPKTNPAAQVLLSASSPPNSLCVSQAQAGYANVQSIHPPPFSGQP